jgi:hypothetical protein
LKPDSVSEVVMCVKFVMEHKRQYMLRARINNTIFSVHNLTRTKYLVANTNVKKLKMRQLSSGNLIFFLLPLNVGAQEKGIINIEY